MTQQDDLFTVGSIILSERGVTTVGWIGLAICFLWLLTDMKAMSNGAFSYWVALTGLFECCCSVAAFRRWNYVSVKERGMAASGAFCLVIGTVSSLIQLVRS